MKTAQEWFDEYAISHQNETNQLVHYICVPVIFFSVIGLLMSIPNKFLERYLWFVQSIDRKLGSRCWNYYLIFLPAFRFLVFYRNAFCNATVYYRKLLVE